VTAHYDCLSSECELNVVVGFCVVAFVIYECQAHSARVRELLCPRRNQDAPFLRNDTNRCAAAINAKRWVKALPGRHLFSAPAGVAVLRRDEGSRAPG
jgi:hypothetical protein